MVTQSLLTPATRTELEARLERSQNHVALLSATLRRLLDAPDLNLDDLEPETCRAISQAQYALKKVDAP